jgi:NAD(P)H-hydrate epimerase
MKRVVYGNQMQAVDHYTIKEIGIPSLVLMERAAYGCVESIEGKRILVVCGTGNNGADGVALARMLYLKKKQVEIYVPVLKQGSTEWETQAEIASKIGVPFVTNPDFSSYDCIVDAIFGVGLAREITGDYAKVIHQINAADAYVVAVDVPSGVDSTTGQVLGVAVEADQTVTFGVAKTGLLLYPGASYAGDLKVCDIGFPEVAYKLAVTPLYYGIQDIHTYLPKRRADSHKGTYGRILIVAGSKDMPGACFLSASAAYASGGGIVRILTHEDHKSMMHTLLPEAIVSAYGDELNRIAIDSALAWADVIVAGPGLGQSALAEQLVELVLKTGKPTVLDADAINLLAGREVLRQLLHSEVVLTPHVGEMARLCQCTIKEVENHLIETAVTCGKTYGVTCVLKSSRTVVADDKGNVYINTAGNPGMAKGGSGDVLSGVLGAMLGNKCIQSMPQYQEALTFSKAVIGVVLHSMAGDVAAERRGTYGMLARDTIEGIREIMG